jgi:hypothetical protein
MLTLTCTSRRAFPRGLTHTVIGKPRRAREQVGHLEELVSLR